MSSSSAANEIKDNDRSYELVDVRPAYLRYIIEVIEFSLQDQEFCGALKKSKHKLDLSELKTIIDDIKKVLIGQEKKDFIEQRNEKTEFEAAFAKLYASLRNFIDTSNKIKNEEKGEISKRTNVKAVFIENIWESLGSVYGNDSKSYFDSAQAALIDLWRRNHSKQSVTKPNYTNTVEYKDFTKDLSHKYHLAIKFQNKNDADEWVKVNQYNRDPRCQYLCKVVAILEKVFPKNMRYSVMGIFGSKSTFEEFEAILKNPAFADKPYYVLDYIRFTFKNKIDSELKDSTKHGKPHYVFYKGIISLVDDLDNKLKDPKSKSDLSEFSKNINDIIPGKNIDSELAALQKEFSEIIISKDADNSASSERSNRAGAS